MLKKYGQPLSKSYTVLRCQSGAKACYAYRLSYPCPMGRCAVPPDRTVLSAGLFSSFPFLFGLT